MESILPIIHPAAITIMSPVFVGFDIFINTAELLVTLCTVAQWKMSHRIRTVGQMCRDKLAVLGFKTEDVQFCAFPSINPSDHMATMFEWATWTNCRSPYLDVAPGPLFSLRVRFVANHTRLIDITLFYSRKEAEEHFQCIRELDLRRVPHLANAPNQIYDLYFLVWLLEYELMNTRHFYETGPAIRGSRRDDDDEENDDS